MEIEPSLRSVSDDELLRRLGDLASRSNRLEADLVAHIGEVDERRLFARFAFPSMFAYCTQSLHLSEADAYRRITVARTARKHPQLLEALRDGRVHLSGLALLIVVVNAENCAAVLARAAYRTRRQIEELVAELSPRPDAASVIRKLPQRTTAATGAVCTSGEGELFPGRVATSSESQPATEPDPGAPVPAVPCTSPPTARAGARLATIEPLSAARYKVQFTASAELRDKLDRLTALLRSEVPSGDLAVIVDKAVSGMLDRIEARRLSKVKDPRRTLATSDPSSRSRHIPAAVRRAVCERDDSRCRFVDEHGRRCSERNRLEFHHRHPFAMGGDHSSGNISLLCPQHNRLMAELDYGRSAVRHPAS
jgi:5-methylcytosine-specific restriction endonuclease McrA